MDVAEQLQAARASLVRMLAELTQIDPALRVEYLPVPHIHTVSAVLTTEGIPETLVIVPAEPAYLYAVDRGHVKTASEAWLLYTTRLPSDRWPEGLDVACMARDRDTLLTAIRSWRRSADPRPRLACPTWSVADLGPLRALAAARPGAVGADSGTLTNAPLRTENLALEREIDMALLADTLTPSAWGRFSEDIKHLDGRALIAGVPRDEKGRFELAETVLLACYETTEPQRATYQLWLTAATPPRRRDPQVVTLSVRPLIGMNHAHRWDNARWLWDSRHATADEFTRWGVSYLPLEQLGLDGRDAHIADLRDLLASQPDDFASRAALSILLQDDGRLEEALDLFGVMLTARAAATLRGTTFSWDGGKEAAAWAHFLQDLLRHAALWRLAGTVGAEAERLRAPASGKQRRKARCPRLRIQALPNQVQQSKASLMLVGAGPDCRQPCLEIESTASNFRLAEQLWRRPVDLDLARFFPSDSAANPSGAKAPAHKCRSDFPKGNRTDRAKS